MDDGDPIDYAAIQDAKDVQREADAEAACYETQAAAHQEGRGVACGDCSGCEAGKQLLQTIDKELAQRFLKGEITKDDLLPNMEIVNL